MKLHDSRLFISATDLSNHLACRHLTELDRAFAEGRLDPPNRYDPKLAVLRQRGLEHERRYLEQLRAEGLRIVELEEGGTEGSSFARAREAMREGADVIYQATLVGGRWRGRADVLRRVERPSDLGAWSYEVVDTKLARETRAGTLLQLCLYSDLLAGIQGVRPRLMYVVVPGEELVTQRYRVDDFLAYYRLVRRRLEERLEAGPEASDSYPLPVPHCDVCRWWNRCVRRRHEDDHLCLVAGMGRLHQRELSRWEIGTLRELADLPLPLDRRPERGSVEVYEKLREQARVQREAPPATRRDTASRHLSSRCLEELPWDVGSILSSMKLKTSVTLSEETVRAIDAIAGRGSNRSGLIEQAVVEFLERRRRKERDARDLDILNRNAEALNEEVEDTLAYQTER